jgi:hypothetical protein
VGPEVVQHEHVLHAAAGVGPGRDQLRVQICQTAVIADAFQGTWNVIDQISSATQAGKTYFGAQTPITDGGACSNVKIARSAGIPPTVGVFSSLVSLLTS